LGEVGAGDQQGVAVGDGDLGVHFRARFGAGTGRPVPQLDTGDGLKRRGGLSTGQSAERS
jgi:hypothetical protein